MTAELEPLSGKYDGTHIIITYRDGFSPEFFTIKCEGHREPSRRQLEKWNITLEQWKNNEVVKTEYRGEMPAREVPESQFYETKEGFLRALATINAINNA